MNAWRMWYIGWTSCVFLYDIVDIHIYIYTWLQKVINMSMYWCLFICWWVDGLRTWMENVPHHQATCCQHVCSFAACYSSIACADRSYLFALDNLDRHTCRKSCWIENQAVDSCYRSRFRDSKSTSTAPSGARAVEFGTSDLKLLRGVCSSWHQRSHLAQKPMSWHPWTS